MNEIKNKNLFIRVSEKEKNLIERNADRCGLTVSEYLRQRALGYMPRAVLPEVWVWLWVYFGGGGVGLGGEVLWGKVVEFGW